VPESKKNTKNFTKPGDAYRLLHTADWHLGKTLNEQSRAEEHRRFLEWLLVAVIAHEVDAIILAGDVFDSAYPSQAAQKMYYDFIGRLRGVGDCALAVIAGNHDSAQQLETPRQPLQFLKTFVTGALEELPEHRMLLLPNAKEPKVALAMIPYLHERDLRRGKAGETNDQIRRQMSEGLRDCYHEAAAAITESHPDLPTVATGHLTVLGSTASDSEREIHIGGLDAVKLECFPNSFAYVALGHLHRPQAAKGDARVRYSGSPIALSFSESTDEKEVRLVDVTPDGVTDTGLPIPVFRRLAQLKTETAMAETALEKFQPGSSELTPWVEVVVKDAVLKSDLNERLRQVDVGERFEVLTVLRGGKLEPPPPPPFPGDKRGGEGWDGEDPLDDPMAIFEQRMGQFPDLKASDKKELKRAFNRLLELDAEAHPNDG
jgi:exonuclease SbcD